MDWLSKLPVIGPAASWLMTTHLWRAYERMGQVHWTRLAAAITFTSFVAIFPLLTVAAAIGAALLSDQQLHDLQKKIAEQIPGISGQLDLGGLVENAGTVGVIAGVALLFTGAGWVDSIRDCLRAVWEKEDEDTNVFVAKLKDVALLLGLGGTALVSLACSAFATAAVGKAAEALGLAEGGVGSVLLSAAGFCIAVLADFLLFAYVLTKLPGLKLLLSGYLKGVAAKSMYGAFGTPIALLLWINFTAKLVVFCAAWTATQRCDAEAEGKELDCDPGAEEEGARPEVKAASESGRGEGAGG
ncbi:YihY/virulence factor BrkB family protein, partial [Streptomyces rimosus]|uniref:YihY/virulence factor BrkB family protein n=1 Tax=Streptomyces rimosus TaxID=1927 RepID=UPI00067D8509